jgi:purine-cytosine permease-like protein
MLKMIVKNLFRRKTRTLLTMLGIAVGVSMIVALGAMAEASAPATCRCSPAAGPT